MTKEVTNTDAQVRDISEEALKSPANPQELIKKSKRRQDSLISHIG